MKKGFTLVELSIVLVIIGLLIGGILAAQSMIQTTKVSGVIKQLSQYDVAVSNVLLKYKGLPGDDRVLTDNWGNGNGYIGENNWEAVYFWPGLTYYANVKNFNGHDFLGRDGNNLHFGELDYWPPIYSYGANTGIVGVPWGPNSGVTGNSYGLISFYNGGWTAGVTQPFKAGEAAAIDTKMDDANPNAGIVGKITTSDANRALEGLAALPNCVNPGNSAQYNIGASGEICGLYIQMGSNVGSKGFID